MDEEEKKSNVVASAGGGLKAADTRPEGARAKPKSAGPLPQRALRKVLFTEGVALGGMTVPTVAVIAVLVTIVFLVYGVWSGLFAGGVGLAYVAGRTANASVEMGERRSVRRSRPASSGSSSGGAGGARAPRIRTLGDLPPTFKTGGG